MSFGRLSGVAVSPTGTIVALNRGHQLACPDENTLYLANLYSSRLDKWVVP
jgi:hypothetical protein